LNKREAISFGTGSERIFLLEPVAGKKMLQSRAIPLAFSLIDRWRSLSIAGGEDLIDSVRFCQDASEVVYGFESEKYENAKSEEFV
jgi:hypothetical protein